MVARQQIALVLTALVAVVFLRVHFDLSTLGTNALLSKSFRQKVRARGRLHALRESGLLEESSKGALSCRPPDQGNFAFPLPVTFTYGTSMGLSNQLLAHLNVLALACYTNATLAIPHSYARAEYRVQESAWKPVPADTLLDTGRMVSFWEQKGLRILKELPDLSSCERISMVHAGFTYTERGHWVYTLPEAATALLGNVTTRLRAVRQEGRPDPPCVHMELGHPLQLLNQERSIEYLQHAAQGLFFAPKVVDASVVILQLLRERGHGTFKGVHLRLEADWTPHLVHVKDPLNPYLISMRKAGFNATDLVYAASGVFTFWNATELESMEARIRGEGLMAAMVHKETLMPPSLLQEFNLEQQALLDLLVISQSQVFVGHPYSTLTCYVRELRALWGIPKSTYFPTQAPLRARYYFAPDPPPPQL